jgi:hypothetical protein
VAHDSVTRDGQLRASSNALFMASFSHATQAVAFHLWNGSGLFTYSTSRPYSECGGGMTGKQA